MKTKIAGHKLRISVGIPAFNEEKNIMNLLNDILSQVRENFELLEVLVVSDGSSDRTNEIVSGFNDKRIKLIADDKRLGKPSRLNMIFKLFKGDILILHDADVLFSNTDVYQKLLTQFLKDSKTKLVIGSAQTLPGVTLIGKAIENFYSAREYFRKEFDYRKTIYGARAGAFALSKDFAKRIKLRSGLLNDDTYIYLLARSKKLKIRFEANAVIWYMSAQTISDYRKQTIRYIRGGIQNRKLFNADFLNKECYIPKKILIKTMLYQVLLNPAGYLLLKANTVYSRNYVRVMGDIESAKWDMVISSKNLDQNSLINIEVLADLFPTFTTLILRLKGSPNFRKGLEKL